jgi:anaerobic magnesium-protoporphyrin IX monomethyl ester cyclase
MSEEILLINPPFTDKESYRYFIKSLGTKAVPPLGLAYLAAYLEKEGFKVSILDAIAEMIEPDKLIYLVGKISPRLVGITATTPMYANAVEVAKRIKDAFPDIVTVLGGPHASAMPEEVLVNSGKIDFVVIGEGEDTFFELVNSVLSNKPTDAIKGIGFRKQGRVIINQPREYIENLDLLPHPARHLLPMRLYRPSPLNYRYLPATSVICGRGCPLNCIFCTKHIFGQRLRLRSPENILGELKELKEKYGIREIHFYDDTFTFNKEWTKRLCALIGDMGFSWWCNGRVDDIDTDLLKSMKNAGCYRIYFGVESSHRESLQFLKKKTKIEDIVSAFRMSRKCGIESAAFMILGIPGETKEMMRENIRFVKKIGADHAVFTVLTPYPGTELYEKAPLLGKMRFKNWSDFVMISDSPVFVANSITEDDLRETLNFVYRSFVFNMRFILNKLKDIFFSPHKFFIYLKGAGAWLKELIMA